MNYETRILAFIDIMGFSAKVKSSEKNSNDVKLIYDALSQIRELFLDESYKEFDTQVTQFSDSLIISINESQQSGIYHMVTDCSFAIHSLLSNGFLCRGIIMEGELIHNDTILFGPLYMKATEAEANEDLPIIKVKKDIIQIARRYPNEVNIGLEDEEIEFVLTHLKELNETEYYVNYFENYHTLIGAGNTETKEYFENARTFIESGLKTAKTFSIYRKFDWTRNRFNESSVLKEYNIIAITNKQPIKRRIGMFPQSIKDRVYSWAKKVYLKKK